MFNIPDSAVSEYERMQDALGDEPLFYEEHLPEGFHGLTR